MQPLWLSDGNGRRRLCLMFSSQPRPWDWSLEIEFGPHRAVDASGVWTPVSRRPPFQLCNCVCTSALTGALCRAGHLGIS